MSGACPGALRGVLPGSERTPGLREQGQAAGCGGLPPAGAAVLWQRGLRCPLVKGKGGRTLGLPRCLLGGVSYLAFHKWVACNTAALKGADGNRVIRPRYLRQKVQRYGGYSDAARCI